MTDEITADGLRQRIARLEEERDNYQRDMTAQVSSRLGRYQGQIEVLLQWLKSLEGETDDDGE